MTPKPHEKKMLHFKMISLLAALFSSSFAMASAPISCAERNVSENGFQMTGQLVSQEKITGIFAGTGRLSSMDRASRKRLPPNRHHLSKTERTKIAV